MNAILSQSPKLVSISNLNVSYHAGDKRIPILRGVSFDIQKREIFGLVGESGCGKSTLAYQLLGFRRAGIEVDGGEVVFEGQDILAMKRRELDQLRGRSIGFVPQNPTTALNPGIRVGKQIWEVLAAHTNGSADENQRRVLEVLRLVGLPTPAVTQLRYPHQLSGGQQQRIAIAMAIACEPKLLVLDEPATGLDVTTQKKIAALLVDLRNRLDVAMLYVTHDLSFLSQMADRVGVMYAGKMVEVASSDILFSHPQHPYTRALISCVPRIDGHQAHAYRLRGALKRSELPEGCPFQPRCDHAVTECVTKNPALEQLGGQHAAACLRLKDLDLDRELPISAVARQLRRPGTDTLLTLDSVAISYRKRSSFIPARFRRSTPQVVSPTSFNIRRGETFALVGESGSGKSTIARAISGLLPPESGEITFDGQVLPADVKDRTNDLRRQIQFIFQNPDASLNPRKSIGSIILRHIRFFDASVSRTDRERVARALVDVRLDASYAERYPNQISGGERQRVAIARALAVNPKLILCDEILSALDVSVQASIIDLLMRLRMEHDLALLFISHDLAVVRNLADRVAVLYLGQLMEIGTTPELFSPPFHPYTYLLLSAVPTMTRIAEQDQQSPRAGLETSIAKKPQGCAFAGRCPYQLGAICETQAPPFQRTGPESGISCHIPLSDLAGLTGHERVLQSERTYGETDGQFALPDKYQVKDTRRGRLSK